jgi:sugar-specific transcriptional regulator TrmB
MLSDNQAQLSLIELGLTALEADIYVALLKNSPVTGYAIAKSIGKPVANVYKALETLESKGAVEIERSRAKQIRPTPWKQFLHTLELRFRKNRDQVSEGLRNLPGPERDARIYHLREADQVLGKASQLLNSAKTVALIDAHWTRLHELKPLIRNSIDKGVTVALKVYDEFEIQGADVVLDPKSEIIHSRWPGQWIVMTVDGSQLLLALLTTHSSRVVQAVWSSSPFLSWIYHSSLHHEISLTSLYKRLEDGESFESLQYLEELLDRYAAPRAEGYQRLREQLGLAESNQTL